MSTSSGAFLGGGSIKSRASGGSGRAVASGNAVFGGGHNASDDNDSDSFVLKSEAVVSVGSGLTAVGPVASPAKLSAAGAGAASNSGQYGSAQIAAAGFFSSVIKWVSDKLFTPAVPHEQWNLVEMFGSAATEHAMLAKYNGAGIHVGLYDDGIDKSVGALMTHYDASRELVINGVKADPGQLSGGGLGVHGTATAGIIAADPSKTGGEVTGIAYGASLTSVNIFSGQASFYDGFLNAVRQMANFDVTSNSWASATKWLDIDYGPYSYSAVQADNLAYAATVGRGGLGTVIVKAAGNDWTHDHRDANAELFNADRHVVVVGAVGSDHSVSSYATRGAAILTSAPSSGSKLSITTTDRTGAAGYANGSVTSTFGGTSAATPEVAAVVADMLGANGKLGARDVQSILAMASHDNELPFFAKWATGNMAYGWTVNHANTFNGGGYHFSNDEGFGELNAHDAIREAAVWSYMNPVAQTFSNEVHLSATADGKAVSPSFRGTGFIFNIAGSETVENADLTLNVATNNLNNLKVVLTSASGTQSIILDSSWTLSGYNLQYVPGGAKITLASHAFLGEAAQGTWTAQVYDTFSGDNVKINSAKLDLYGSTPAQSHIYHYTDEAFKMAISDWSRFSLHDTSGKDSWIDTAMMTGSETINLNPGTYQYENGAIFSRIANDTTINNVTLGDGPCTVFCNNNSDKVVAGNGTAWIYGGQGNDTFIAGSGTQTISSGGGYDNFVFDHRGFGTTIVTDFTRGLDHLDLRGLGLSLGNLGIADNGSTIVISNFDADGDKIVLANTHQQHLSSNDFWFA